MDTIPETDPMEIPPPTPLRGLNPADLLKQAVAEETFVEDVSSPFTPPTIEELDAGFPQFEILELIGKGGMGAIYKVRQKDLDRIVALKILPPEIGHSHELSGRFTREAKALAKLNHPGIVTIHEFGERNGLPFILMEFVDGVNLAQLMKSGRISPREALAIVPQICDALQYAHDQGIVHRDIKPENILLDRLGRVKVADFGIAKVVAAASEEPTGSSDQTCRQDQTLAGKIIGTPAYMAPEQIERPSDVDHRADIYALGVVFYQMLTGELPGNRPEAPSKKVLIDVRLDEIVLQAMEKKPEMRFQQASMMKTRMDGLGMTTVEPATRNQEPANVKTRSTGWMIIISCSVVALAGFLLIVLALCLFWFMKSKSIDLAAEQSRTAAGREIELAAYDWSKLASKDRIGGGVQVTKDGRSALKIENTKDTPLQVRILTIDTPPVRATQYAVSGQIRYDNVQGTAYLEMWNEFPNGRFFSRTLGPPGSGAMGQLSGTSTWRDFSLPFDRTGTEGPPKRLEVNLFLPGRGTVFIGQIKLSEFGTPGEMIHALDTNDGKQQRSGTHMAESIQEESPHRAIHVVPPPALRPATKVTGTMALPKDFSEEKQAAIIGAAKALLQSCSLTESVTESRMREATNDTAHIQIQFSDAAAQGYYDEILITFPLTSGSVWTKLVNTDLQHTIFYQRHTKFSPAAAVALSEALGEKPEKSFLDAAAAQMTPEKTVAVALAETWLAGIDAGDYAQSWKTAAAVFQKAITEDGWNDALTKARKPLGTMNSRKLLDARNAKTLPGAPDGEYVVMRFETSFAAKEKAVETVTFMKEQDGTWKAAGYFIH